MASSVADETSTDRSEAARALIAYHRRTRHRLDGYAKGPETLDWDAQPSPYRHYAGAPVLPLPLVSDEIAASYAAITGQQAIAPMAADLPTLAGVLELAFGLSAVKVWGPDRWALRCNPSSGNLHPTEIYVLAGGVAGFPDGVHHYRVDQHALEQRLAGTPVQGGLWIGLSSVLWREAWKYGERALRYCQLDIGHALGALTAACATLGWQAHLVPGLDGAAIGLLLGLDRAADFGRAEREEAEALVYIDTAPTAICRAQIPVPQFAGPGRWAGIANLLDPRPIYHWPVVAEAATASCGRTEAIDLVSATPALPAPDRRAAKVILARRSAQRFARDAVMPRASFDRLIASVSSLLATTPLHLLLFVHNVEELARGLYAVPGHRGTLPALRARLGAGFAWADVDGSPDLHQLGGGDFRKLVRGLSCHQAIAADACLSLSMVAPLEETVAQAPWHYRSLHWQAGLIGQRLYLEATALGFDGTGIGCFLDEEVQRMFGLAPESLAPLYHFAIGRAVVDERISATPPYPGRVRNEARPTPR